MSLIYKHRDNIKRISNRYKYLNNGFNEKYT